MAFEERFAGFAMALAALAAVIVVSANADLQFSARLTAGGPSLSLSVAAVRVEIEF